MPPKNDGDASSAAKKPQKKPRNRNKPRKKKDCECQSRVPKTSRVVLNSQARNIIAKVYDFMKSEAINNFPLKFKNASWRTAIAVGVSEKTVFRILRDRRQQEKAASVAGTGALLSKKVDAANDTGKAVNDLLHGNVSGAAENLVDAVGSCVGGDVAVLGIAAAGIASATGDIVDAKVQATEKLVGTTGNATENLLGANAAIGNVSAGISALGSGNVTGAVTDFGGAAGALLAGGEAALDNLFVGSSFRRAL